MARRKKKRSPRRNRSKGINVISLAEGYVQSNIWTEKLFNTNPFEFVTGVTGGTFNPGADGGGVISIPEMLGIRKDGGTGALGGNFGTYASNLPEAVARNVTGRAKSSPVEVATGLIMPAFQTALVGAGFKFGKKVTSKPRAAINRGLRQFGLGDFIRF